MVRSGDGCRLDINKRFRTVGGTGITSRPQSSGVRVALPDWRSRRNQKACQLRFSITRRLRSLLPSYWAVVGKDEFVLRRRGSLFHRFIQDWEEWHGHWPARGEVRLQLPLHAWSAKSAWRVLLIDETICTGTLKQSFMPSKNDGIHWRFQDDVLMDRSLPRLRMHHAVRNSSQLVLACWNPGCYGAQGVIRSSLPPDIIMGLFGIAAISVLISS